MTYECKKIVFTPALQSYKAMIWATQGAVLPNSNFDEITSNLLSYKAMKWATPEAVFTNICLKIGITDQQRLIWFSTPGQDPPKTNLRLDSTIPSGDQKTLTNKHG